MGPNVGEVFLAFWMLLGMLCIPLSVYILAKKLLTKDRFLRFVGCLVIGLASATIPFGFMGIMCGFPAVIVSSILTTLFLDRFKKEKK